jgi:hypothetical protein
VQQLCPASFRALGLRHEDLGGFRPNLPNGIDYPKQCHVGGASHARPSACRHYAVGLHANADHGRRGGSHVPRGVNLFRLWSITDEEAATLLDLPVRTYRRWQAEGPAGSAETARRGCPTS